MYHPIVVSVDFSGEIDDAIRGTQMCRVEVKFMDVVWVEDASVVVPIVAEM